MESLKYLNEADITQLVPSIGLRSILRGCLYHQNHQNDVSDVSLTKIIV